MAKIPNFNPFGLYIVNVTFTEILDYTGGRYTKWRDVSTQLTFLESFRPMSASVSCIHSDGNGKTERTWRCIFDNSEVGSVIKIQHSDLDVSVQEYYDHRIAEEYYLEQQRLKKEKNKLIYQKRKLQECQKKPEHSGN